MVNANDFQGKTDSEVLNNAVMGRGADGIVAVPPRCSETEPERDFWLLDSAVLLPENTTVVLQNCKLKLSDRARDNFFRSANCGLGIEFPERIHNIHIRGEGLCILDGADHPRATGDSSKLLRAPCPHFPEDICRVADWIPEERRTPDKVSFADLHAHSYLCYAVRLLPALTKIYNVVIDGIVDTSPETGLARGTLLLGDGGTYGENKPESMRNVTVSNVICNSKNAIVVRGFLTDSVITNVVNRNPDCPVLTVSRDDGLKNVLFNNLVSAAAAERFS